MERIKDRTWTLKHYLWPTSCIRRVQFRTTTQQLEKDVLDFSTFLCTNDCINSQMGVFSLLSFFLQQWSKVQTHSHASKEKKSEASDPRVEEPIKDNKITPVIYSSKTFWIDTFRNLQLAHFQYQLWSYLVAGEFSPLARIFDYIQTNIRAVKA